MRSQIKIGNHAVESAVLLKGIGLGVAVAAGVLGWMWRRRQAGRVQMPAHNNHHNFFERIGRKWPQAVPVK